MRYPIHPDHALLVWSLNHGLWAQRFDPSSPSKEESNGVLRWLARGSPRPALLAQEQNARAVSPAPTDDKNRSVLVVYESDRGRASLAADAIADAIISHGAASLTGTIDEIGSAQVAAADTVIAGCWTPGKCPVGEEPARRLAHWIEALPSLDEKTVGVFCTYRFFPHTFADMVARLAVVESRLVNLLDRKGATVAATRAIHFKSIEADAEEFVGRVLEHTHAA
ncbi:MAG: hypothetical protein ABFR53_06335 [Actinomycetota bacterium]